MFLSIYCKVPFRPMRNVAGRSAAIKVSPSHAMKAHGRCRSKCPQQLHSEGRGGQPYARMSFTPRKAQVLILKDSEWTPGPVRTSRGDPPTPRIEPGRPARSQVPRRLSYLAHHSVADTSEIHRDLPHLCELMRHRV